MKIRELLEKINKIRDLDRMLERLTEEVEYHKPDDTWNDLAVQSYKKKAEMLPKTKQSLEDLLNEEI